MADWQVFARDEQLTQDDELPILALSGVLKHLEVSTATLRTPFSVGAYARTGPGCGIIVRRDGVDLLTGPVVSQELGWDDDSGRVVIDLRVLGDETQLDRRIVFPDPTRAGDAQSTVDYWNYPAGQVLVLPLRAQAARLIRDRLNAGLEVAEDFSWAGNPVLVRQHNDALSAGFFADNPGSAWPSSSSRAAEWLSDYVTANTPTGGVATVASSAMLALISSQAGGTALAANRIPRLYLGPDPGVGASQAWSFRYDNLLGALASMSARSQVNLGVRVGSTPDGLQASLYLPRDLSREVRFSAEIGNLTGVAYTRTAPEVTAAVAAGGGDLKLRLQRLVTSAEPLDAAWGLPSWSYVDRRDTTDADELIKSATDAVADGVGTVSVAVTLIDTDAVRYGRDWGPYPGDRVTVEVGLPGVGLISTVTDLIRQIRFDVDDTGAESIRPAVGTPDATAVIPSPSRAALASIGSRLTLLERRK